MVANYAVKLSRTLNLAISLLSFFRLTLSIMKNCMLTVVIPVINKPFDLSELIEKVNSLL